MAPNFASLLNRPADQVKRPVTLPDGTYFGVIDKHELGESQQKKTPFVQYNVKLTHPHEDTDSEGVDPKDKKLRLTFYITEESEFRLIDFLKSCGITTEGRTLGELIPQPIGQTVMVDVVKKPNQAGDDYFNEIKKAVGLSVEEPTEQEQISEAQGRRRRA